MAPTAFLKSTAIKFLPPPVRRWVRGFLWTHLKMRQGPAKPLDLSRLALLRNATLEQLRDVAFLENELLPALGLNDEGFQQIPPELHRYCGAGLRCWQYPRQLSGYLVLLSELGIGSYLEVGVRHGGTFVLTTEYLRRFHPLPAALAVDLGDCPALRGYASTQGGIRFVQADSQSPEFRSLLAASEPFDLALIDGDHSLEGCWKDFLLVKDRASILAFHDIASDVVPGVGEVWRKLRADYAAAYEFFEFTAQYASLRRTTGKNFLGLGVAVPPGRAAGLPAWLRPRHNQRQTLG